MDQYAARSMQFSRHSSSRLELHSNTAALRTVSRGQFRDELEIHLFTQSGLRLISLRTRVHIFCGVCLSTQNVENYRSEIDDVTW